MINERRLPDLGPDATLVDDLLDLQAGLQYLREAILADAGAWRKHATTSTDRLRRDLRLAALAIGSGNPEYQRLCALVDQRLAQAHQHTQTHADTLAIHLLQVDRLQQQLAAVGTRYFERANASRRGRRKQGEGE